MSVPHLLSFQKNVRKLVRARARIAAVNPGVALLAVMELAGSCDSNVVTSPTNILGTTDPYPQGKNAGEKGRAQCTLAREGNIKFTIVVPKVGGIFVDGQCSIVW